MKTIIMALSLNIAALSATAAQAADNKEKVLVVMSGAGQLTLQSGKRHPTGYFLSELTGPAQALTAAGYELIFANPSGKEPPMDKTSDAASWFATPEGYAAAKKFIADNTNLKRPRKLGSFTKKELKGFKAVFIPGGHAPLEDLAHDKDLGRILKLFHDLKKTTALICHGPAALLSSVGQGKWIYSGYKMTAFSTAEEQQSENNGGLEGLVKFYLADELSRAGGVMETGAPWASHAVRDRELITGQNPMSEADFTKLLLQALLSAEK